MSNIQIDDRILAVIVSRLGGSVTVSTQEALRMPAGGLRVITEPADRGFTFEVSSRAHGDAIDAEFTVVE